MSDDAMPVTERLLCIDVGNTNVNAAVMAGAGIVTRASFRTAAIEDGLRRLAELPRTDHCAIASVDPGITARLRRWAAEGGGVCVDVGLVGRAIVETRLRRPDRLGADRLANAVAAYDRVAGAAIVVDAGTALTFDCISADGVYLGGAIGPGLEMSSRSLARETALLDEVTLAPPVHAIGETTDEAIRSGVVLGCARLVDGMVPALAAEMGGSPRVFLTGGDASLLAPQIRAEIEPVPNLTLEGIASIWRRTQ